MKLFIIHDFFTKIGEKIPAWGGEDTQTEHFFNCIGAVIARNRYHQYQSDYLYGEKLCYGQ
jgi:hypothetical protein